MIIDVNAHFEPAANWLDEFPRLKAELPERFPDTDPRFRMDTGEGNPDPLAYYDGELAQLDAATRDQFLGATIADDYGRMGDPV